MIEQFFVWLLGPNLCCAALVIILALIGAGLPICFIHMLEFGRWPWEKE